MRTLLIQGTEKQINNFILDNELLQIKENKFQLMETRVYVVNTDNYEFDTSPKTWNDEKFMSEAEIQGTVYTLPSFQEDFNIGKYEMHYVIRFINVPLNN